VFTIPVLIIGAILLGVLGYWLSFFSGKKGSEVRKETWNNEAGWFFNYLAWVFLIFGVAWLLGQINFAFFDGHLFDFLND
jgi:prepilin-type processing-associated H-X9-DG protein